jgi:hypothetical protein
MKRAAVRFMFFFSCLFMIVGMIACKSSTDTPSASPSNPKTYPPIAITTTEIPPAYTPALLSPIQPASTTLSPLPSQSTVNNKSPSPTSTVSVENIKFTETFLGTLPAGISETQYCISPDSTRIAVVNTPEKNVCFVSVNGKDGAKYAFAENMVFSPDSQSYAYTADTGEQWLVVVNGEETRISDGFIQNIYFSPDSMRIAITVCIGKEWYVVLDGEASEAYDDISIAGFSPDSRRFAYSASSNGESFMIVDGLRGGSYDSISPAGFSSDSQKFAYIAYRESQCFAIINGERGQQFDYIDYIRISPGGKKYAYSARKGNVWYMVVDGISGPEYEQLGDWLFISPDGTRLAYAAKKSGKWWVFVDGVASKTSYDQQPFEIVFSPDSRRIAYQVHSSGESWVVLDDIEENHYQFVGNMTFSPDSKRLAYFAFSKTSSGNKYFCVVDGVVSKGYYDIQMISSRPVFSPDSQRLAFKASIDIGSDEIIVDGEEIGPYTHAGQPLFSPDSKTIMYTVSSESKVAINGTYYEYQCLSTPLFDSSGVIHFIAQKQESANGNKTSHVYLVWGYPGTREGMEAPLSTTAIETPVATSFELPALVQLNPPRKSSQQYQLSKETVQKTMDAFLTVRPVVLPPKTEISNPKALFNINSYFKVLKHLSMEPGYVLDYYMFGEDMFGSRPLIYVRKEGQSPISSYEEFEKWMQKQPDEDATYKFVSLVMEGDKSGLNDHIIVDGTTEGYFEYVLLNMMGGQFYLSWHANYDDATIISSTASLQKIIDEGEVFRDNQPYPESIQRKTRYLEPDVTVVFANSKVQVSVLCFTKWGGFIRRTFTINEKAPHSITNIKDNTQVEYECGVMF